MSSFHKMSVTQNNIIGTKIKNNLLYVSSGIPSLDHILGGGLPTSSIFMIEEDVLRNYSRVMNKYFLAEGIVCNHGLFIASADDDPELTVKELPTPTSRSDDDAPQECEQKDKMKIAWRYETLGPVESSFGANTKFGHHFDLSKHVDIEIIKNSNITYWNYSNKAQDTHGFQNSLYLNLLKSIKELVARKEYSSDNEQPQNVLRISISSLGSPIWMAMDCERGSDHISYAQDLIKFVYCLRVILRDKNAVAFVTMPSHLFEDESIVKRLLYSVDNAVKLESFAGSSRETNPVFKDYHGLFHITKLSAINSLVPFLPPSLDLAFKLRRKKFVIEKLHLPPELEETSEREQDDITSTPVACGGFNKKDIDF